LSEGSDVLPEARDIPSSPAGVRLSRTRAAA
jgi:hypothetical protein